MDQTKSSTNKSKCVPKRTKHHRKRHLDKSNDVNNEPHRKKMKIHRAINALRASNQSLKQEIRKIKQHNNALTKKAEMNQEGVTNYKKEAEKWKSEYMQLYNQLQQITNKNTNTNPNTSEKHIYSIISTNNNNAVTSSDHINNNTQSTTTNDILSSNHRIQTTNPTNSVEISTNNNTNNNITFSDHIINDINIQSTTTNETTNSVDAFQSGVDTDIPMNMLNMPNIELQLPNDITGNINNVINDILNRNNYDSNASPPPAQPRQFSKQKTSISSIHVDNNDNRMDEDYNSESSQSFVNDNESDESDSCTESDDSSEDDKPTINKVKQKNKVTGKNSDGSQRCGRLLLNDAIKNTTTMTGWSEARKKAYIQRKQNLNGYYYRFLDPGKKQKNGEFSKKEHKLFMKQVKKRGVNYKWGIFSRCLSGRVGYQCSNYWRLLMKRGIVTDHNYWYDKKDKKFIMQRNTKDFPISSEYRRYAFVVNHDSSGVWKKLPKKHPKHPSDIYCNQVIKALGTHGDAKPKYSDKNINIDSDSESNDDSNVINFAGDGQNDAKYDEVRDRLLEMKFDRHEIENKIALYNGSGKNANFVLNQLIRVFCNDNDAKIGSRRMRSDRKTRKKKVNYNYDSGSESDNNDNTEYVRFNDSFYISVNCHMCNIHFNDIDKYEDHIHKHYLCDKTKQWLNCDFNGCDRKSKNAKLFIRHISTHTKQKPYHCDVKINGVKCTHVNGYIHTMKTHWKAHFKINQNNNNSNNSNNNNNNNNSSSNNDYSDSSEYDNESVSCNNNINHEFEKESDFENSYYVSVHCHICKKHFGQYDDYREHLKAHYANDETKKWRQCDFGCRKHSDKPLYGDATTFVAHISSHTNENLWHCNVIVDGKKCSKNYTQKCSLKNHWKKEHRNKKQDKNIDKSWDEISSDSD